MQSDWDSLFFQYRPHADQLPQHDERLLKDIGLTRTGSGALAWAEDPSHLVQAAEPTKWDGWRRLLAWWAGPARPTLSGSALRPSACGK